MTETTAKEARRRAILEIVARQAIRTQAELVAELRRLGVPATQTTVSRDIRELGLRKVPSGDGRTHYAPPPQNASLPRLGALLLGVDASENLVVIRTLPDVAATVQRAVQSMRLEGVLGTICDEGIVVLVVKPKELAPSLASELLRRLT